MPVQLELIEEVPVTGRLEIDPFTLKVTVPVSDPFPFSTSWPAAAI